MKTRRPKPHTDAFWEALVRRSVTPEQVAPHVPELSEFDIAAEMVKARRRLDEQAQEQAEDGEACDDAADVPLCMQERSTWSHRPRELRGVR